MDKNNNKKYFIDSKEILKKSKKFKSNRDLFKHLESKGEKIKEDTFNKLCNSNWGLPNVINIIMEISRETKTPINKIIKQK